MQESELKSVTESLYKQNQELAVKNKTLSLLGSLYDISLQALTPRELAKKITQALQSVFEFELVIILNYSEHTDRLTSLALAESARFKGAEKGSKFFQGAITILDASANPFFKTLLEERKMTHSSNLSEIWGHSVSTERIKKLQEEGHVQATLAYSLISGQRIMGVLMIELNRHFDQLAEYEKKSLNDISNVTAIALEKAIIYEKLQITNDELAQANDRQEGLIHFISHQIKGYLTKSQAAFAGILEGDYGEAPPPIQSVAKLAMADSREGVETVQGILNASNLKKGTVAFEKTPFNLRKLVELSAEQKRKDAEAKGLSLTLDIKTAEYIFVGDKEKLEKHVIGNLLDNALKYTLYGGLKISLSKNNDKILFSVKDSGVGISPDDKKRLFTEGGKGKDSSKINVDSTGYGLFIAKQVVEAHGGKIWAESEGPGKGSTFFVELPAS